MVKVIALTSRPYCTLPSFEQNQPSKQRLSSPSLSSGNTLAVPTETNHAASLNKNHTLHPNTTSTFLPNPSTSLKRTSYFSLDALPFKKRFLLSHPNSSPARSSDNDEESQSLVKAIEQWRTMPSIERKSIKTTEFADRHHLSPNVFRKYINTKGILHPRGQTLLDKEKGIQYRNIDAKDIEAWCHLTTEERHNTTLSEFAKQHLLNPNALERCITKKGAITSYGQYILDLTKGIQYKNINAHALQRWRDMGAEERNTHTLLDFAKQHQFNPFLWQRCIKKNGKITHYGQLILDIEHKKNYRDISASDIHNWCSMTQNERNTITFYGFSNQHQLNPSLWKNCVTAKGKVRKNGQRILDKSHGIRYQEITAKHIHIWCSMKQSERAKFTLHEFSTQHQLNPYVWKNCVTKKGTIRLDGQYILDKEKKCPYNNLTVNHIRSWCGMTQDERNAITLYGFVVQHHLNLSTWQCHVNKKGELLPRGQYLLDREEKTPYKKITAHDIQAWCQLSQKERDEITSYGFAKKHQLNFRTWENYINRKGVIRPHGQHIIDKQNKLTYKKVSAADVQDWNNFSQFERDKIGLYGFAIKRQLNLRTWQAYVMQNGTILAPGQVLLQKTSGLKYRKICANDINTWHQMTPDQRNAMTLSIFSKNHQLNFVNFKKYIHEDGTLTSKGKNSLAKYQVNSDGHSSKTVIAENFLEESLSASAPSSQNNPNFLLPSTSSRQDIKPLSFSPPVQIITHEIDNNAPILKHHVTGESVTGNSDAHPSRNAWQMLNPFLQPFNKHQQQAIKRNIINQAKEWIETEGHHQQRFDESLYITRVIDDSPARGTSVFAKKMIPKFTVIGPYSGTFLPDKNALEACEKQHGKNNVHTYLYQAGPNSGPNQDKMISAFRVGNITSLINDAELDQPLLDPKGKILRNNLIAIRLDNKIFLVSIQSIMPDEELFLDYGKNYQEQFQEHTASQDQNKIIKSE